LSRSTASSSDCAGFTLIEVVVTLAMLSVVLVSIGGLVGVTVRGIHALDDHLALMETARAIETSLANRNVLQTGSMSGATGGQQWRVDVRPYENVAVDTKTPPVWLPMTETITVQAADGTSVHLTTLRLHPRATR
jgi:general secretion pathway protein I